MEQKSREKHMIMLRRPSTILLLVLLVGVGANVTLVMLKLMPLVTGEHTLTQKAVSAENQMRVQEGKPVPAKVKAADFEPLLKQVPVGANLSGFLLSLRTIEENTGVILSSIGIGAGKNDETPLAAINGALQQLSGNEGKSGIEPQTNAPSATGKTKGNPVAATFMPTSVTVQLTGTYLQITGFMKQLYQLDRIVNIRQWQFSANGASLTAAIPNGTPASKSSSKPNESTEQPILQMTMMLDIFSAKQYAGKVPDLPAQAAGTPDNRADPTMMDDNFEKQLRSLQ